MPIDHRAELSAIKRFDQLIRYLRDRMGWPIEGDDFEEMTFEYSPAELGIDSKNAARIQEIKRLRPLVPHQPWGIFFVKFEPKRLPVVALRRILGSVAVKKRTSTNSAERRAWAADDLLFVSNFGEGDNRQISFAHFSAAHDGRDLPTLKVLGWNNLDTALHLDAVAKDLSDDLAWPDDDTDAEGWRRRWRAAFTLQNREVVTTSKELSIRLAELARVIRDRIKSALAIETEAGSLTELMKAFQTSLVHDLDADGFADMYAQTIAYGLLSARIADPQKKTVDDFAGHMRTNPFLRELMETFLKVGGRRGKAGEPGIDFDELGAGDVVELLDDANMEAVVRDFGDKNPQEDPVIHFYELFLKEYDAKKRMQRGVFYTPRPVVSYIVRSVHELLRTEFGLADGLADITTWGEMANRHKALKIPEGVLPNQAFLQILDPATGTGTFLVEVIDLIHKTLVAKWTAQDQTKARIDVLWNQYVKKHLLTRLHGYELLMAPYAIAHLKIGLKLYETGYRFGSDERARVFLTNALEPATDIQFQITAMPALAHEAQAVNEIKRTGRFTVILGNPPYSNFGQLNRIPFVRKLLEDYKRGLDEKKINLDDDFIKFVRWAQHTIDLVGVGVLGMITNNVYFDGITHRRMRQSLLHSFRAAWLLNLHGSTKRAEKCPDGSADNNVFDILVGVGIGIFLKPLQESSRFHVYDLWGSRAMKYAALLSETALTLKWTTAEPLEPHYFFLPPQVAGNSEYASFVHLNEIFEVFGNGIGTDRDNLFYDIERPVLADRIRRFYSAEGSTKAFAEAYGVHDSSSFPLLARRKATRFNEANIRRCLYRPFDTRWLYYDPNIISRPAREVMQHLVSKNIALLTTRQLSTRDFHHVFITDTIADRDPLSIATRERTQVFPLYKRQADDSLALGHAESQNVKASFIQKILSARGSSPPGPHTPPAVGPKDAFHYVYAVLHSPTYRRKYVESLRIDFPRVPIAATIGLFRDLAQLGEELVSLHLFKSSKSGKGSMRYSGPKNPRVGRVTWSANTIWLDSSSTKRGHSDTPGTIGFRGVPSGVWEFHVGGYQVCEKWLKDRTGRSLSGEDIIHYQGVLAALAETIRLAEEIDEAIEGQGGWPEAFDGATPASSMVPLRRKVAEMVKRPYRNRER